MKKFITIIAVVFICIAIIGLGANFDRQLSITNQHVKSDRIDPGPANLFWELLAKKTKSDWQWLPYL